MHGIGTGMLLLSLGVAGAARAAGLTPGRILVTTDQSATPANTLYEYTTGGVKTQTFAVPFPTTPRDNYVRDIAVAPGGSVQIFNGTFAPVLTTLDPVSGAVAHHTGDFSVANNVSYGGVAVFNNFVFVGDENTANSPNTGILRFDAANNYAATRFRSGTEYERVSVGANGLLYALQGNEFLGLPGVDVFDPQTMSLIRSVKLAADSRAVAADAAGDLFVADWDGRVYHYTPTGTLLNTRDLGFGNIEDIDISPSGQLVIGGRFGDVILTDTSLSSQTSFKASGTPVFVAFTSPVPEPTGVGALCVGGAGLLLRRRRVR
jgi:hypothetical protein